MAMTYSLHPGETEILRAQKVKYARLMNPSGDELVLTDRRLILIRKGWNGETKDVRFFDLQDIDFKDGEPAVYMDAEWESLRLLIISIHGRKEEFALRAADQDTLMRWVNEIWYLVSDLPLPYPDAGINPDYLKEDMIMKEQEKPLSYLNVPTFDWNEDTSRLTIRNIPAADFNEDTSQFAVRSIAAPEKKRVTVRCFACRAPLTGEVGEVVKCRYCDTEQTIQSAE